MSTQILLLTFLYNLLYFLFILFGTRNVHVILLYSSNALGNAISCKIIIITQWPCEMRHTTAHEIITYFYLQPLKVHNSYLFVHILFFVRWYVAFLSFVYISQESQYVSRSARNIICIRGCTFVSSIHTHEKMH